MKKQILIFVVMGILFAGQVAAQSSIANYQDIAELKSYYFQGDELWLNDTTVYYTGDADLWTPEKRNIVVSRDGLGQELETLSEIFNPQTNEWEQYRKDNKAYYYLYDTSVLKEHIASFWDKASRQWITYSYLKYDSSENLVERISKELNDNNSLEGNGARELFDYDKNHQLRSLTYFEWNDKQQEWAQKSRKIFSQGNNSFAETTVTDIWDEQSNAWIHNAKTNVIKNELGKVTSREIINYAQDGIKINGIEHFKYKYDISGNLIEVEKVHESNGISFGDKEMSFIRENGEVAKKVYLYLNQDGNWVVDKESSFKYIPYQNRVVNVERGWDNVNNEWYNISREVVLRGNDKIISSLHQIWERDMDDWVNLKEFTFDYAGDNLRTKTENSWDPNLEKWKKIYLTQINYNEQNLPVSETGSHFSNANNDWLPEYNKHWEYDMAGNIVEFIISNGSDQKFFHGRKVIYNWHMFALSKTESRENYTIEVFPNPTKGVLHIKSMAGTLSRIAILDEFGRMIEAISLDQQSTTVDISHLVSGNYFIECKNGSRKNTFKVVKL